MRTSSRKSRVLAVVTAAVSLLGGAILVVGPFGGAGFVGAAGTPLPPSTAYGESLLFKAAVDGTFCLDEQSGSTQGRMVILSTCTTADSQRWTLTHDPDGSNAMVDSQGMCIDSTGRKVNDGTAVEVFDCNLHSHQRFSYTADGLIQAKQGCLSVPGAAVGAPVSLVTCDSTSNRQLFHLAH